MLFKNKNTNIWEIRKIPYENLKYEKVGMAILVTESVISKFICFSDTEAQAKWQKMANAQR